MTYSCDGKTHSELTFWYRGANPTADQRLNFYVDGVLYNTYGSTPNGVGGYPFVQVKLALPDGHHDYRWEATSSSAAQPPYWVDSISCTEGSAVAEPIGTYGFEECFPPAEVTGSWEIDNSSRQAGTFGAHPAILAAGDTASLNFSCGGKAHTQLSFFYQGINPTAGQTLKFYVDGTLYQTYGSTPNGVGGYPFAKVSITLPSGGHSYRWDVTTDVASQPPYWLDTIQCQ